MPYLEIDAVEAWKALSKNGSGRWPQRDPKGSRLEPICRPSFTSNFTFTNEAKVFTIGSCFARNVERGLIDLGFDVPARGFKVPLSELGQGGGDDPSQILNKYTPFSMEQEVEFALYPGRISATDCLFGEDLVYDTQLAIGDQVTRERGLERREEVRSLFEGIKTTDIVFVTLGLSETWFDKQTGLHWNRPVPMRTANREKGRFVFQVAGFDEIRTSTARLIDLLQSAMVEGSKIILTVSPVPLNATFAQTDVITANTYSKAALRVAAEELSRTKDEVYYYPSFESVTLSESKEAWYDDLRHVRDELVRYNVATFLAAVTGGVMDPRSRVDLIKTQALGGDLDGAILALSELAEENSDDPMFLFELAKMQFQAHRYEEAVKTCSDLLNIFPLDRGAHFLKGKSEFLGGLIADAVESCAKTVELGEREAIVWLGRALARQGKHEEALEQFRSVPTKALSYTDAMFQGGISLIALGKLEEARETLTSVLQYAPKHSGAYVRLAEVELKSGNLDDAVRLATTASTLQEKLWYAHQIQAEAFLEKGELGDAEKHAKLALELNPASARAAKIAEQCANGGRLQVGEN